MSVDAKAAYDAWHSDLPVDTDASDPWHLLVRAHMNFARDLEGCDVLEIGCGRGGFSCWLAGQAKPKRQVAIDFSEVAVERAKAHAVQVGASEVQWEFGDIQQIDHPSSTFDTVISCETIEHVPDPPRAVRELARVLRPGGKLFLTTPNYLGTIGLYRAYLRLRGRVFTEVGQPINQFTMIPRLLLWARSAGLSVRTIDATGHYIPFPGRPAIRVRALDRARFVTRWLAHHSLIVATKS